MKSKKVVLSAITVGCLLFSGMSVAGYVKTELISPATNPVYVEPNPDFELVTTNVLLRQILAEVIKANSLKEDNRCSDGEKKYSPGYIISVGNKTLRYQQGLPAMDREEQSLKAEKTSA